MADEKAEIPPAVKVIDSAFCKIQIACSLEEARLIQTALGRRDVRAFVAIVGLLDRLPSDVARRNALDRATRLLDARANRNSET
jgi:hypothetical protein